MIKFHWIISLSAGCHTLAQNTGGRYPACTTVCVEWGSPRQCSEAGPACSLRRREWCETGWSGEQRRSDLNQVVWYKSSVLNYNDLQAKLIWLIPMQVMAGHSYFLLHSSMCLTLKTGSGLGACKDMAKYCTMNGIIMILIIVYLYNRLITFCSLMVVTLSHLQKVAL